MTPWVQRLLVANVVLFFVDSQFPVVGNILALRPMWVLQAPWTPLTYMFIHGGFSHLFFNMFGLVVFGPRLEERLGSNSFIKFYLVAGLGGAVFSFIFAPYGAVIGASGAIFGVMLGFARYWPRDEIYIWGILPIQARVLALILIATSLYMSFAGSSSNVAHFAHLGGLGAGWLYLRMRERSMKVRKVERPNSFFKSPGVQDIDAHGRWESIPRDSLHEVNREELDLLLEKIAKVGVKGLSDDERSFLNRMADSV